MNPVNLLIYFALIGFALWLIYTYIPMPAPMKNLLTVVTVLILVVWLLRTLPVLLH